MRTSGLYYSEKLGCNAIGINGTYKSVCLLVRWSVGERNIRKERPSFWSCVVFLRRALIKFLTAVVFASFGGLRQLIVGVLSAEADAAAGGGAGQSLNATPTALHQQNARRIDGRVGAQ